MCTFSKIIKLICGKICCIQELILDNDLKRTRQIWPQTSLMILEKVCLYTAMGWNMLPSIITFDFICHMVNF